MTLPAVGLNGGATDWFPLPGSYAARLADPLQLAEAVQAAVGRRAPGGVDGRLSGSSFIGRTAELAALRSAIDEASAAAAGSWR